MSKALPKIARKHRTAVRATRAKTTDKILVFTKADLARQYKAARRFLALPTVTVPGRTASDERC